MSTQTAEQTAQMEALLDATLDDLEDLPEFKPFPIGAHKASVKLETKAVNGKPCIEAKFTYIEPLELSDPTEAPPKAGDTANTLYDMTNEFGQGKFKQDFGPIGKALGFSSIRDIVAGIQGTEVNIVSNIRKDKNDATKTYFALKSVQLA